MPLALSPVPEISISLASPEEPPVPEPFSPFAQCTFLTDDQDSFRPSLLSPPPSLRPPLTGQDYKSGHAIRTHSIGRIPQTLAFFLARRTVCVCVHSATRVTLSHCQASYFRRYASRPLCLFPQSNHTVFGPL